MSEIWKDIKGYEGLEFPRMTWKDAMNNYGSDKPDIRYDLKLVDLTSVFAISGATILGDGQVALIIDCNALIK